MKKLKLEKIKDKYHVFGSGGIISIALIEWRESKLAGKEKPTMKSLSDALVASALDSHLMCQVCIKWKISDHESNYMLFTV